MYTKRLIAAIVLITVAAIMAPPTPALAQDQVINLGGGRVLLPLPNVQNRGLRASDTSGDLYAKSGFLEFGNFSTFELMIVWPFKRSEVGSMETFFSCEITRNTHISLNNFGIDHRSETIEGALRRIADTELRVVVIGSFRRTPTHLKCKELEVTAVVDIK